MNELVITFVPHAFEGLPIEVRAAMLDYAREVHALHVNAQTGEINVTALSEDIADRFERWEDNEYNPADECCELALMVCDAYDSGAPPRWWGSLLQQNGGGQ